MSSGGGGLQTADIYDHVSGSFSAASLMNVQRVYHTATLMLDGRVLITGGVIDNAATASAEIYDPATGIFSVISPMNSERALHTATLLPGASGRVLLAGGISAGGFATAAAEVFDPLTSSFVVISPMNKARQEHTATLLHDGRVLLATGRLESTAEIFDQSIGLFVVTGNPIWNRFGHTATLLSDGRVLFEGGSSSGGLTNGVEIFDATGNGGYGTFTATAYRSTPCCLHSAATLLPGGKVLVTGGAEGVYSTPLAWLFHP